MSREKIASTVGKSVAIIGAGALGLVATKNLIEEGFEVTTFEKNTYVGGLWHATQDPLETSALLGTVSNGSKQTSAFSDFPMPNSFPTFPTAQDLEKYFEAYADHFELRRSIRFSTTVISIIRDDMNKKWIIEFRNNKEENRMLSEYLAFDRLVMASGSNSKPYTPEIKGIEKFNGQIMHSQAFKNPSMFENKTVLIVGISNSSADATSLLIGAGAAKVYVSHRRKFITVRRMTKGKPLDCYLTLRNQMLGSWLQRLAPTFQARLTTKILEMLQNQHFPKLKKQLCQNDRRNYPPHGHFVPVMSENLADNFIEGKAQSVQAIEEVTGPSSVKLHDGEELRDIDGILFCTGLHPDLASMLPSSADPYNQAHAPELYATLPADYVDDRRVSRVYRGFLSLQYPNSLAFLGTTLLLRPDFPFYDLLTMALAQLWSGKSSMPTEQDMKANADAHLRRLAKTMSKHGDVQHSGNIDHFKLDAWLHRVARTDLLPHVSFFSWKSWKFYWSDPSLHKMLLDGPPTAHALRLFETGGRKAWPGAKDAIVQANKDAKELRRRYKEGMIV